MTNQLIQKKDPTNQDIMDELDKAEQRDRISIWLTVVAVGFGFTASSAVAHQWWMTLIGAVMMIAGYLAAQFRLPPGWHYRQKP